MYTLKTKPLIKGIFEIKDALIFLRDLLKLFRELKSPTSGLRYPYYPGFDNCRVKCRGCQINLRLAGDVNSRIVRRVAPLAPNRSFIDLRRRDLRAADVSVRPQHRRHRRSCRSSHNSASFRRVVLSVRPVVGAV